MDIDFYIIILKIVLYLNFIYYNCISSKDRVEMIDKLEFNNIKLNIV